MQKVSVIIPVYNVEKYLNKCLDSVLGQTYKNLEVLCVNDKSTDSSFDILTKYASEDNRVKVIDLQENVGAAEARNKALDVMSGDLVYFIDSDDWINCDYIEKMVNAIESSGAEIVMNRAILDEFTNGEVKEYVFGRDNLLQDNTFVDAKTAITDIWCTIWSKIYKRELFDKYNLRFYPRLENDDFCFHYCSLIHIKELYLIRESNYHYLQREGSVMQKQRHKDVGHYKALSKVFDYYSENNLLEEGVKLFSVFPFCSVESEEKYEFYKAYFVKIKNYLCLHKNLYNEIDLFFANNILSTQNYEEYKQNYPASVAISFLKRNRVKV